MNNLRFYIAIIFLALYSVGCTKEKKVPIYEHFFAPDSFSPNNDGLNDTFTIIQPSNVELTNYHISIYNVSLQLMFTSNDITTGWDGKYNGIEAETGFYEYQILYTASTDSINYDDYIASSKVNLFR